VRRAAPVRWRSYQTDWRGAIVGYDIPKLRGELNASRDYLFAAADIERDLFRA
jgi:5-methylthioadenosine/S-adenosylhomocysteine deaminase